MKVWIRVQDARAQFDHPKGEPLPNGVSPVRGYPEHVGLWARDPKKRVTKAGKPVARFSRKTI